MELIFHDKQTSDKIHTEFIYQLGDPSPNIPELQAILDPRFEELSYASRKR